MGFSLKNGGYPELWIGKFDIFPDEIFAHGVSTRHGGFSTGALASLNLGLHVDDDPALVVRNRELFCRSLGADFESLVTCQQVHGVKVAKATRCEAGMGSRNYESSIPDTDALITNEPGLPLMLFFADCTPIMIADPVNRAIGVAHGGWKGTLGGIAVITIEAMAREYGSRPENLLASVGPSIGPCCYAVRSDVADRFQERYPGYADDILKLENGEIMLNLWECNRRQLLDAGVPAKNIDKADTCTSCNHKQFFSYRADKGKTGRIGALMMIR